MANPQDDNETPDVRGALEIATTVAGLAVYAIVLGGIVSWVRLAAAHLPTDLTTALLDPRMLFAVGLRAIGVAALLLGGICLLAYFASRPGWATQGEDWRNALGPGSDEPDREMLGEGAVRVVAGLNVLAISGAIGLGVATLLESHVATQWVSAAFVGVWVAATGLLAWRSAKLLSRRVRGWVVVVVAIFALFCEFPIALLLLTAVAIAASGGAIAKLRRPRTVTGFLRSPLPWALAGVYALVALSFVATPPVNYPRALVQTADATQVGGYLARTDDGVYLATCTPLPEDRSTSERVVLVRSESVRGLTLGGESYRLDSGDRPALLNVLLRPFGLDVSPPVVLRVDLRAARPVCDATERATSGPDQGLGPGVITDPRPSQTPAPDAEPRVDTTTTPALAALALRYQPTVETTVADRFWPSSVSSVMAERSADGTRTCLVIADRCRKKSPVLADLTPTGGADDYLDLPASLASNPTRQFLAFTHGQDVDDSTATGWLSTPAALNPWASSSVYFYYAGKADGVARYGSIPAGLLALQYWFFYPYNYYPTVVQRHLMLASPIGGVRYNTDLHEGDWEHVTVLIDATTYKPRYLYFARHDIEGVAVSWNNPSLAFDGTHPIVQAALGGHPSYDNHCGERPRALLRKQSSDWVVCATGRYTFRAETTPLVDLARAGWSCWPGHFGEATAEQRRLAALPESDPRRWKAKVVHVAGPRSPLRQAENTDVCRRGPLAAEQAAPIR